MRNVRMEVWLMAAVLFGFSVITCNLHAAIEVSGNITEDTTWDANSVYVVTDTLQVWDDVTLNIESGVTIFVNDWVMIKVAGNIIANGTTNSPICFTSLNIKWGGIELINSNGSSFSKCIFENADYVFKLTGTSPLILEDSILRDNTSLINDDGGYQSMNIEYCNIENNGTVFYQVRTNGLSAFKYNIFINNTDLFNIGYYFGTTEIQFNNFVNNNIYLEAPAEGYGYGTVDAKNNWWGTTNTSVIDSYIYDKYDDVSLQIINYLPIQMTVIENIGSSIADCPIEPPEAVCLGNPIMDFNDDCKVDFEDFAIFTQSWLECNLDPPSACWE